MRRFSKSTLKHQFRNTPKDNVSSTLYRPVRYSNWGAAGRTYFNRPEMKEGFDSAYSNDRGYSVRDIDGVPTMFIRGSKDINDWIANAYGYGTRKELQVFTNKRARYYDKVAKQHGVRQVFGHSRGGMYAARMKYGKAGGMVRYGAVDGAMILARGNEKNTFNIHQGQLFDRTIAKNGLDNHEIPFEDYDQFHKIYA
jgi:hypothetical protein